jgi:hypothetical protein
MAVPGGGRLTPGTTAGGLGVVEPKVGICDDAGRRCIGQKHASGCPLIDGHLRRTPFPCATQVRAGERDARVLDRHLTTSPPRRLPRRPRTDRRDRTVHRQLQRLRPTIHLDQDRRAGPQEGGQTTRHFRPTALGEALDERELGFAVLGDQFGGGPDLVDDSVADFDDRGG